MLGKGLWLVASELSVGGEMLGRVCQHSEAMQWVQGMWRLRRRQWKRQEAVRSWWKTGFPCLEKVEGGDPF